MPFHLTAAQQQLQSEVQTFVEAEIAPIADDLDRNEEYPADILHQLAEQGYTGLIVPGEFNGQGKGLVEFVLLIEELSTALMPVASALALHVGVAAVIERFGSSQLKDRYLPSMAAFETVGVLGLSERNAGSDKSRMETTARQDGDGWVLNGHKQWVTNYQNSDVALTYARTATQRDESGTAAFLIPREEFQIDHVWETLGARSVKSVQVSLTDVRVPDSHRVGSPTRALGERSELQTGVNLPARAVGLARAAFADVVSYTTDRSQYDQPIGEFQGVRWTVADIAQQIECARLLTYRAADRADRGLDAQLDRQMAKVFATEMAVEVTNTALQLHGGIGYTTKASVERYLRDARLLTIAGGPNAIHRDGVAAKIYDQGKR